jgi:hypothetical protein
MKTLPTQSTNLAPVHQHDMEGGPSPRWANPIFFHENGRRGFRLGPTLAHALLWVYTHIPRTNPLHLGIVFVLTEKLFPRYHHPKVFSGKKFYGTTTTLKPRISNTIHTSTHTITLIILHYQHRITLLLTVQHPQNSR